MIDRDEPHFVEYGRTGIDSVLTADQVVNLLSNFDETAGRTAVLLFRKGLIDGEEFLGLFGHQGHELSSRTEHVKYYGEEHAAKKFVKKDRRSY